MKVLVINCGSSSAKYELFNMRDCRAITEGKIERIVKYSDYARAIREIKDKLFKPGRHAIKSLSEIAGIGHRVVHGGEEFKDSTLITGKVIKSIDKFSELAPLHNPPSLAGIKACLKIFPGIPQVAVFDTAFHQSMPRYSYIYGIPYEFYKKFGIRRYGFHGTSHRYVAYKAAEILGKRLVHLKVVTVHLGNGCSMAAVLRGRSVDTSMGFTPLEGLLMGTRSGDIDPAIIIYLMEKMKLSTKEMNDLLNKKSGLLGVSGISNDMRDLLRYVKKGNSRARLALNIFVYRIKKYIGAYASAMGGLDAVVFTAGIGERMKSIKDRIRRESGPVFGRNVEYMIVPTNEELLIARDTSRIIKRLKRRK